MAHGLEDNVKEYLEQLRRDLKQARKSGALILSHDPIKVTPEAQAAHGSEKLKERLPAYQAAYQRLFMLSNERKFEGEKEYAALYLDMRENEGEALRQRIAGGLSIYVHLTAPLPFITHQCMLGL